MKTIRNEENKENTTNYKKINVILKDYQHPRDITEKKKQRNKYK